MSPTFTRTDVTLEMYVNTGGWNRMWNVVELPWLTLLIGLKNMGAF